MSDFVLNFSLKLKGIKLNKDKVTFQPIIIVNGQAIQELDIVTLYDGYDLTVENFFTQTVPEVFVNIIRGNVKPQQFIR